MKRPLRFSAIIIFHNQADFVRAAMDSVINQAVDGLEVIAVDDGSTDGTREVLNEYRGWARLVLLDQNRGASAARNEGMKVATGDYLAYLDGDDAFLPWAIDTYRRVAETQAPVLMMGLMRWFEGALPEAGPTPHRVQYVRYDDYFGKERVVDISASAIVVHRRSLESVGGWEGFPMEDLDLLYRLGTAGPFVQITEPSTTWHRSHNRQTVRQTERIIKGAEWLVANDKRGRYPGGDSRRLERRACIGGIVLHWARKHAKLGSRRHAIRFLVRNGPYVVAAVVVRARRTISGRRMPHGEALLSR
jgi:glycosyltransferase involved in cell wall biosynthesis